MWRSTIMIARVLSAGLPSSMMQSRSSDDAPDDTKTL
jgi:hypothetical protein